jgi:hypothetical protein
VSREQEQQFVDAMVAKGIRAVHASEWTPELALSVLRENRRRYAGKPFMEQMTKVGAQLAHELACESGIDPAVISEVILRASAKVAALTVVNDIPGRMLVEIWQCAADDLERQARAGEQS